MDGSAVATRYWHRTGDGRVQCDVCPRACRLHEGQRGFCFVRSAGGRDRADDLRPLQRLLRRTRSRRSRSTTSCPARRCCPSARPAATWAASSARTGTSPRSRETDTLADQAAPQAIALAAARLGCRSVAFTYNDPVIFLEYAIDVADACREAGIKAVAVTAGYMCAQPRAEFYGHMDAANVDLKGFTERLLPPGCAGRPGPGAGDPAVPQARDQRLAGDHQPAHPGRQRLRCRDSTP